MVTLLKGGMVRVVFGTFSGCDSKGPLGSRTIIGGPELVRPRGALLGQRLSASVCLCHQTKVSRSFESDKVYLVSLVRLDAILQL